MLASHTISEVLLAGLQALLFAICLPGVPFGPLCLLAACLKNTNARIRRYVLHGTWTCAATSILLMLLAAGAGETIEVENVFFSAILLGLAGAFWGGTIAALIEAPKKAKPLLWALLGILFVILLIAWVWLTQMMLAWSDFAG